MALRNLALGLLRRPVAPAEPAWDRLGHTALTAFARVAELEAEPRIRGGKAGKAQVDARIEAKALAWKLLAEWVEGRRLDGRSVDGGSASSEIAMEQQQ
jgi:hypothetical protein